MLALLVAASLAAAPLRVGVTLHPYYSWTARVTAGLPVTVVPVLPGDVDAGSYQPRPDDVKALASLDALVVNGLGHDDFVFEMLKASGNTRCVVLRPNEGAALLKGPGGGAVNSHTFLSLTNAIQQSYALARALGALRPEWAPTLTKNAGAYARALRALKASATRRLEGAKETRVVTVHDGYGYLLQELGLELVGVVEPAHGLVPSAAELAEVVALLRRERVRVVLSEERFPPALGRVLEEAGATVTVVSHVATGAYSPERFEVEMARSLDALLAAVGAPPAR